MSHPSTAPGGAEGGDDKRRVRDVRDPYDGSVICRVFDGCERDVDRALDGARLAQQKLRRAPAYVRGAMLADVADAIVRSQDSFVEAIVREAGKPITLAAGEVARAAGTFRIAAEEATRVQGYLVPMDRDEAGSRFAPASVRFVPRGAVLAITPFNFPLNLLAHKVAPALAVGCAVVVKPAPQTPTPAMLLAEAVWNAQQRHAPQLLEPVVRVVHAEPDIVGGFLDDPRIATISFTGSAAVGTLLRRRAPRTYTVLEQGGSAPVIVHADADLARAAERTAWGAYAYAGQVCISVQRVLVHESVRVPFESLLRGAIARLVVGDPYDSNVIVGPVISDAARGRIVRACDQAVARGAVRLCGGAGHANVIPPTLLTDVPNDDPLVQEEVFGPVAVLASYRSWDEAVFMANDTPFGLQAGVFTSDLRLAHRASEELDMGGIAINEIPTFRADHLPYGGVKGSGMGREGVRSAMRELCDTRTVMTYLG